MTIADHIAARLDAIDDASTLNAFVTVDREGAMAAAHAADERRAAGQSLGPLDGEPIAVKDNLDTAGLRTTYGLGIFRDRVPDTDAAIVHRLKAAGAVIVGKTNMTELACGTVGVNVHYGDVQHPAGGDRYPGGSSSGSAAAVGAGLVEDAIGTDTGGSIRHPAATCGVVGLKPTFGRTPNDGASVCARTMDHVGPMSISAAHAADVLAVIQNESFDDPTRSLGAPIAGARIAVLTGEFLDASTDDVVAAFEPALPVFESLGCSMHELDLGLDLKAIDDELANALGSDLIDEYGELLAAAGRSAVGPELWEWYDLYRGIDPSVRAGAVESQRTLTRRVVEAMAGYDAVICPTTRTATGTIAEGQAAARFDRVGNLALWDVTGQPSITVPFGEDADSMPFGLLLTGHPGADGRLLQIADAVEQATRFAEFPGRFDRAATRVS